MTRYWFSPGNMAEEQTRIEMRELAEAGFGGVELITLGARAVYNSLEWNETVYWILDECDQLGLHVATTLGPGWPIATRWVGEGELGGYTDSWEDPRVEQVLHVAAESFTATTGAMDYTVSQWPNPGSVNIADHPFKLLAVTASKQNTNGTYDADTTAVLTGQVDPDTGALSWTAPSTGNWTIFYSYQQASGSGFGTQAGPVIDHMSKEAVEAVIQSFDDAFADFDAAHPEYAKTLKQLFQDVPGDFFGDSLELGNKTHWTDTLLDEFLARRGYDLTPYLPAVYHPNGYNDAATSVPYEIEGIGYQVRFDLAQTISELMLENHMETLSNWANEEFGRGLRYQNHLTGGVFFQDVTIPMLGADTPEIESWLSFGGDVLDTYRIQSGVPHYTGSLLSAECAEWMGTAWNGTWTGHLDPVTINHMWFGPMTGIVDFGFMHFTNRMFAVGVNELILHGVSNKQTLDGSFRWPGRSAWEMMPTQNEWGSSTPMWEHNEEMLDYIARAQMILREGRGDIDVGYYRVNTLSNNVIGGNSTMSNFGVAESGMQEIDKAGYTFDYLSPTLIELQDTGTKDGRTVISPDGAAYKALVIDQRRSGSTTEPFPMTLETANQILRYAEAGLPIVIVGDAPYKLGSYSGDDDQVGDTAQLAQDEAALAAIMDEILEKPTTAHITSPDAIANRTGVAAALAELGVRPDARPGDPATNSLLSYHRSAGDVDYYFLANDSISEPVTQQVTLTGGGKPYLLDPWSGEIRPIANFTTEDNGAVTIDVSLAPNAQIFVALAPDGWFSRTHTFDTVTSDADEVLYTENGNIAIRTTEAGSYNATLDGQAVAVTVPAAEASVNLGDGAHEWTFVLHQWRPKDTLDAADLDDRIATVIVDTAPYTITDLETWGDIDSALEYEVGRGSYETTFTLTNGWAEGQGAILQFEEVSDVMRVWINGQRVFPDQVSMCVDIGPYLVAGDNKLEVDVTSNLANHKAGPDAEVYSMGGFTNSPSAKGSYVTYKFGIMGDVYITPYVQTELEIADKRALQELYDECDALSADAYTAESWSALETAMTAAASVLADDDATQAQVNAALAALQAAYDGLVAVYTVTFVTGSDTLIPAQAVAAGGRVTEPTAPTRDGYVFEGWYTDTTYTTRWNFATGRVTGDMTLYAGWRQLPGEETYTVTFDSRGGSAVASLTAEGGKTIAEPDEPTRRGYTFTGWYKDAACTQAWDFAADTVTGDTTLYAGWATEPGKTVDEDTWEDGTVVTTIEDEETGDKTVIVQQPDGTEAVVDVPAEGEITAEIKLGEGVDETVVVIPLDDLDGGTVAIIVHEDGTEEIIKWSVADDGKLYIPVDGDVTVKIVQNGKSFDDEGDAAWAKDAIAFVTARELFLGTSDTEFAPNLAMSRGMLATVLYRLEGEPQVGENPFEDVEAGEYYEDPITWAEANGVVKGTGGNFFSPKNDITREELAVMLHRYAGEPEREADMSHFPDADKISDWAEDAMTWALAEGIITGKDGNMAEPGSNATRAEVATMLQRFILAG